MGSPAAAAAGGLALRLAVCSHLLLLAFSLPLDHIQLPPGFNISLFAEDVPSARSMTLSASPAPPAALVYVAAQDTGEVYALLDKDGDGRADEKCRVLRGLDTPEGLLWRNGSLFVFEATRLTRHDGIDAAVLNGCKVVLS